MGLSAANNEVTLSISTSTVRSGGGATSILANPSTKLSTNDSLYQMKLFEYPIYTDTTSKTYSMFFHSTSTAQWLSAPTASQLWIECEYWNFPSAFYPSTHIKKSTCTLPFASDQTNWNSLSVTCQPTNTGILILRGWYAKAQETGVSNLFLVDVKPSIQ